MIKSTLPLLVRQNLLVAVLALGTGSFFVSCRGGAPETAGYRESVNRLLDRAEEEGLERLGDSLATAFARLRAGEEQYRPDAVALEDLLQAARQANRRCLDSLRALAVPQGAEIFRDKSIRYARQWDAALSEAIPRWIERVKEDTGHLFLVKMADSLVRPAMMQVSAASDELANAERKLAASR